MTFLIKFQINSNAFLFSILNTLLIYSLAVQYSCYFICLEYAIGLIIIDGSGHTNYLGGSLSSHRDEIIIREVSEVAIMVCIYDEYNPRRPFPQSIDNHQSQFHYWRNYIVQLYIN